MNKFLVNLALVVASLSFASCATPVLDCNNGIPLPALTQVNDCEVMPCALARGSTAVLNITFVLQDYVEELVPEVTAYVLGIGVNYPLDDINGCNGLLTSQCPLDAGEVAVFKMEMPIQYIFPPISLQMRFTMSDENGNGLVCFLVNAVVT